MVFYCFIIKKEGGAFKATGTNDKSKALEGIEGADYKSIVKSIRTTCKATDPANGIKVGGGPTGKNTYVVSVTTGPAMSFSGGGGGGGGAAPAAKGGAAPAAAAPKEEKKEESEEEAMEMGLFD